MIDVKKTIFYTLNNKIDKLRILGRFDPQGFKKLLYLVILDDLYDWSAYLDEPLSVLKKLLELRTDFVLNNKEFLIKYKDKVNADGSIITSAQPYVNVNTPQTIDTWKRVWDDADTIEYGSTCYTVTNGIYVACSEYSNHIIEINETYLEYEDQDDVVINNVYYATNNATGDTLNPTGTVTNNIFSIT